MRIERRLPLALMALCGLALLLAAPAGAALTNDHLPQSLQNRVQGLLTEARNVGLSDAGDTCLVLHRLAKTQNGATVGRATYVLGELRDRRAVQPLINSLLTSTDAHQRRAAATALGKIGDPLAVMPLLETLRRPGENQMVRGAAASALGRLGDARAAESLAYWARHGQGVLKDRAGAALDSLRNQGQERLVSR